MCVAVQFYPRQLNEVFVELRLLRLDNAHGAPLGIIGVIGVPATLEKFRVVPPCIIPNPFRFRGCT